MSPLVGRWRLLGNLDPVEKLTMVFMTQLYPSSVYPIRRQLKTMIYSAIETSYA